MAGVVLLVGGPLAATAPAVAGPQRDVVAEINASVEADEEFRERVDQELPGVFKPEQPGKVPLAFFGKLNCGALVYALDSDIAREDGMHNDPMYQGDVHQVRQNMVELWVEEIGRDDAEEFVDISIDVFCPSLI